MLSAKPKMLFFLRQVMLRHLVKRYLTWKANANANAEPFTTAIATTTTTTTRANSNTNAFEMGDWGLERSCEQGELCGVAGKQLNTQICFGLFGLQRAIKCISMNAIKTKQSRQKQKWSEAQHDLPVTDLLI